MYLIYFFQFIYYVIYMNKIKKFKKSKKTNNKRNHKRRRMTRKLRGGIKEFEGKKESEGIKEFEGKKDNLVIPYDENKKLEPPANDEPPYISSRIEPSQEIQRLEDRIRLLEENATINLTHLDRETQRFEERINEIQQTDNTGELREQITALQRKIEQTEYDLTGIAEILIQEHFLDRDYFNSTRFSQPARKRYMY